MNKQTLLCLGTVGLLAGFAPLQAEIKLTDNFKVEGYGGASVRSTEKSPEDPADTSTLDIATARLLFTGSFEKVTANVGAYYAGSSNEFTLLDANVSYAIGGGSSLTAGNYLSYLGFEAFHITGMTTLTYANGDLLAPIPGYHTGVKYDYAGDGFSVGASVTDSLAGPDALKGDGEVDKNVGLEACFVFTGVEKLTLFAGVGYDTADTSVLVLNGWGSYDFGMVALGAEVTYKDTDNTPAGTGYNALVNAVVKFTDAVSTTFRVGYEDVDSGASFFKGTVAPAYAFTPNLLVRAEYSHYEYDSYAYDSADFIGAQVVFNF